MVMANLWLYLSPLEGELCLKKIGTYSNYKAKKSYYEYFSTNNSTCINTIHVYGKNITSNNLRQIWC